MTDAEIIANDFADELAEYKAGGVCIVNDGSNLILGGVFSDAQFSVLAAAMISGFAHDTGKNPFKVLYGLCVVLDRNGNQEIAGHTQDNYFRVLTAANKLRRV